MIYLIEGWRGYLESDTCEGIVNMISAEKRSVLVAEDDVRVFRVLVYEDSHNLGKILRHHSNELVRVREALTVYNNGEKDLSADLSASKIDMAKKSVAVLFVIDREVVLLEEGGSRVENLAENGRRERAIPRL